VLNELALFASVGGGILATKWMLGWRTVCYVEWNKYAVEVLKARIRDGYLDDAPIWDDANKFDGKPWARLVDVVSAGFPCQPFSVAGKGLAENDPRNGWPATIRILREVRPRIAWLENVPGLLSKRYFGTILGELAEAGYDAKWDCVSAEETGAPHKRERLWIVAHAASQRLESCGINPSSASAKETHKDIRRPTIEQCSWWQIEPKLGRVADGVAHRVDRLEAVGNGQVPLVVAEAWNRLNEE